MLPLQQTQECCLVGVVPAQGPGTYQATDGVGPQVASTKPSTPRFGFGTSDRQHQTKVYLSVEHERAAVGRDSPGPGNYSMMPSTGSKQPQSNINSAASWGFGTGAQPCVVLDLCSHHAQNVHTQCMKQCILATGGGNVYCALFDALPARTDTHLPTGAILNSSHRLPLSAPDHPLPIRCRDATQLC